MENVKRYQVELVGAISHESPRGKKFIKGTSQIITSPHEVAYYKAQPEYIVTRLREAKEAKVTPKAVSRTPVKAPSKAPPPPVDEDDDEDEEDDEEEEEELDSDEDDEEDEEDDEDGEEATSHYSKSRLSPLTKSALVELARSEFKLKVDESASKPQLIGEILKAQLAAAKK